VAFHVCSLALHVCTVPLQVSSVALQVGAVALQPCKMTDLVGKMAKNPWFWWNFEQPRIKATKPAKLWLSSPSPPTELGERVGVRWRVNHLDPGFRMSPGQRGSRTRLNDAGNRKSWTETLLNNQETKQPSRQNFVPSLLCSPIRWGETPSSPNV